MYENKERLDRPVIRVTTRDLSMEEQKLIEQTVRKIAIYRRLKGMERPAFCLTFGEKRIESRLK